MIGMKLCLLLFLLGVVDSFHLRGAETSNPEETPGLFQGDIVPNRLTGRSGILNPAARWPNRTVPYVFESEYSGMMVQMVEKAMTHISTNTENCIRFVRRTTEPDYIKITSSTRGCWSDVGKVGGEQLLSLPYDCVYYGIGIPIHELLHTLGYYHEQSRSDRDQYVRIEFKNIIPGKEHNFEKYNSDYVSNFGVPYDFDSIMHYSAYAFSKNGMPTIVPLKPGHFIGQRKAMSSGDTQKLKNMYECY